MAVYLGTYGRLTLRRKTDEGEKFSIVNPSDVNTTRRRFSFDFEPGFLISGDQIEITSTNNSVLEWVDHTGWANNTKQTSGKWFINVDDIGGIKLYSTFSAALRGNTNDAIILDSFNTAIPIRVKVANAASRILGSITSYELNTNRETVDITSLSEEFRSQYSSLMSGSGRIACQWDYKMAYGKGEHEPANYLLQLILRTEVGSEFEAELFLKVDGYDADRGRSDLDDRLFYRINGVLTNTVIAVQPTAIVEMTADFVTTGPIKLLAITAPQYKLLQENGDRIALEQNAGSYLLLEAED